MSYKVGDRVHFKIPRVYKQSSIEYQHVTGTITETYPKSNGYDVLPDGYDTAFYVPAHHIYGKCQREGLE